MIQRPHRSRRGPLGGCAGFATVLPGGAVLRPFLLALLAGLFLGLASPALAARADSEPPVAELVEGRVTRADPEQTYTLYLPAGYRSPEEARAEEGGDVPRWPVLLVFDPRGRSRLATEWFVRGAETYGWIPPPASRGAPTSAGCWAFPAPWPE